MAVNRAELESRIWRNLQVLGADRHDLARHIVENMLADADAYILRRRDELRAAMAASDTPLNTHLRRAELWADIAREAR